MSKMIAIRLEDGLLAALEKERKRVGLTRARAIREAVRRWIEQAEYDEAVREEHEAYERTPVSDSEFGPILRGQRWPKK